MKKHVLFTALALALALTATAQTGSFKGYKNGTAVFAVKQKLPFATDGNGNWSISLGGYYDSDMDISKYDSISIVDETIKATSITLNQTSLEGCDVSLPTQLSATVLPTSYTEKLLWTSSNPDIASVSETGLVTYNKAGTATITAGTPSGASATCTVTVNQATMRIFDMTADKNYTCVDGGSFTFAADPNKAYYTSLAKNAVASVKGYDLESVTSSNPSVVKVVDYNLAAARKLYFLTAGTAKITYVVNGKSRSCTVNVTTPVSVPATSVDMNYSTYSCWKGSTVQAITCTLSPSNSTDDVTWTSSDTNVAAITESYWGEGEYVSNIEAKQTGTATITATSTSGKSATCALTVMDAVLTQYGSTENFATRTVGNTIELIIADPDTGQPYDAPNATWSVDNASVAGLSTSKGSECMVTPKAAGTAIITVNLGGATRQFTLTVVDGTAPTSFSFSQDTYWVYAGQEFKPTLNVTPADASSDADWLMRYGSTWTSQDHYDNSFPYENKFSYQLDSYGNIVLGPGDVSVMSVDLKATSTKNSNVSATCTVKCVTRYKWRTNNKYFDEKFSKMNSAPFEGSLIEIADTYMDCQIVYYFGGTNKKDQLVLSTDKYKLVSNDESKVQVTKVDDEGGYYKLTFNNLTADDEVRVYYVSGNFKTLFAGFSHAK